ncbi:hypothetical protein [Actinomyces radicidentis]|uniref:hypothetical protein n=1 Tax=Actinomyces radicidentis TaxID=111015 RepID=UPI0026E0265E|nr:hypothetical protein [Actinomyces radicidentis]
MWCVARRRQRPDLFTAEQSHELGQAYLWVGIAAATPPSPPPRSASSSRASTPSPRTSTCPSTSSRTSGASSPFYLGLPDEARAAYERWRTTPRDAHLCAACEVQRAVDDAYQRGEWEEALRYAVPVLDGTLTCGSQPENIQGLVLLPVLLSGRPELAWCYHLSAYLADRSPDADPSWVREHLVYLALSGQVARGMAILRRHADRTARCTWTSDLLEPVTDVVAVDLLRQERAVNAVLEGGDTVASTCALVALAWNLRQAGRDLEALAAVEMGIDIATGAGSRRAPGRVRMLDLHRQALGALNALRDQQGVRAAALACAEVCEDLGEHSDARMYLELAACAALEVDDPLGAAALFRRAAEVRVGGSDGGRADLLGRERHLRRAARARLAFASLAVRRGQADAVDHLLDLAAEGVEALAGLGDAALVEQEREALAADRAWAAERTGR